LSDPLAVAQIDEDQVPVVAAIGNPAKEDDFVSFVVSAQGAAGMCALQFSNKTGHSVLVAFLGENVGPAGPTKGDGL
jgi:hypothetical protein